MVLIYIEAAPIMVHNSEDSVNSNHEIQVPYSLNQAHTHTHTQAHTYITIETAHPQQHTPHTSTHCLFLFLFPFYLFLHVQRFNVFIYPTVNKKQKIDLISPLFSSLFPILHAHLDLI